MFLELFSDHLRLVNGDDDGDGDGDDDDNDGDSCQRKSQSHRILLLIASL